MSCTEEHKEWKVNAESGNAGAGKQGERIECGGEWAVQVHENGECGRTAKSRKMRSAGEWPMPFGFFVLITIFISLIPRLSN